MKRRRSPWAPLYLTLVLVLMYLPIAVVVLYSFNANASRYPNEFTGFRCNTTARCSGTPRACWRR